MCDGDADTDARCAVATRESDAAAGVEVMALPLTVASSRAGHLQQAWGQVRRGKAWGGATCGSVRNMGAVMRMRARGAPATATAANADAVLGCCCCYERWRDGGSVMRDSVAADMRMLRVALSAHKRV